MNIIKEMFRNDVVPALGCTEPVAVAFACSLAQYAVSNGGSKMPISRISVVTDPGIFKNGASVSIPNTNGMKGNQIAAALGAICGKPEFKLEVLRNVTPEYLSQAQGMLADKKVALACNPTWTSLRIEATVENGHEYGLAIIEGSHTNVLICRKGEKDIIDLSGLFNKSCDSTEVLSGTEYRKDLCGMKIADMLELAQSIDSIDRAYIDQGIAMNLAISDKGRCMNGVGSSLASLINQGILLDDLVTSTQIVVASATDARMAGFAMPVMGSGGSGNQGVVASLVPYCVGMKRGVALSKIQESITLSHLLNAYVKCFLGNLSPMCGCAVSAGIGAAAAIVYQQVRDSEIVGKAINNVVGDIAGIICDGAKGGCSLKVATATQASIRAAFLALSEYSIDCLDGIIGRTPEETIQNLWVTDKVGMQDMDGAILGIMAGK